MNRSTRLITATYIMSYVAVKAPDSVTTAQIAKAVKDHPARVRQIVAALVKGKLLASTRGAHGGVRLTRTAESITLRHIYEAVEDRPLLAVSVKEPFPARFCHVHPTFTKLYKSLEEQMRAELEDVWLRDMYTKPPR